MEQNFFKILHPQLDEIFRSCLNSDRYSNIPVVRATEEFTADKLSAIKNLYVQGNSFETQFEVEFAILEYGAAYNECGFITGFALAMQLMRECR